MIITYTDIANETETLEVPLDNLDVGTLKFMEWFQEQSQSNITFNNLAGWNFIKTTDTTKDISEFDFSNADIINPYEEYSEIENSIIIVSPYKKESKTHMHNYMMMDDNSFTSEYVKTLEPITKLYPSIMIFKSLYEPKSSYEQKYNTFKNTLGVDKLNDIRYGYSLVRIAKLNIEPHNAIESLQNISF